MDSKQKLFCIFFTLICMSMLDPALPCSSLASDTIRINGSGTCMEMIKPLIQAYNREHPETVFLVEKSLGSSGALNALMAGALDIAVVSRSLTPDEIAHGVTLRDYGLTPLVIVTNRSVSVTNITAKQLEDIYAGVVTAWPDENIIRIILRPQQETDTRILKSLSPGMDAAINKAHGRRGMQIAMTDPESIAAVSKIRGAIGASTLTHMLVDSPPLNMLTFNGIAPSPANLKNKSYPLAKYIGFATGKKTSGTAAGFIAFAYSDKGRAIAEKYGVLITTAKK